MNLQVSIVPLSKGMG